MGIDGARGRGSLRFSFSILNTPGEARDAAAIVKQAVERMRRENPRGTSPCGMAPA
jgi:cysteine sulfinate desulfinase/cysteine desulfurase-like protein